MNTPIPRRQFLVTSAAGAAALALGGSVGQAAPGGVNPEGPLAPNQRVGFAIVGLGSLSIGELLPAFGATKKCRLVALVSGTPDKAAALAADYGVKPEQIYNYQNYEKMKDNPEIQVVYIVLPNSMHAEYTIRAAQAGKHVLCEKPMATSVADAQKMIDACAAAQRKLMIAYRCQYEVCHRAIIEAVRSQALGPVGVVEAANLQSQGNNGQWRLKKAMAGGGSLVDVGIYCLNSTRAVLNEEPSEISATIWNPPGDPRFTEVEDTVSFTLRFPSGAIANCSTSYSIYGAQGLRLYGPQGSLILENAFGYDGQQLNWAHQIQGVKSVVREVRSAKNQFALEMDHMADSVMRNVTPHTPGEEGLQDHRVIEAIYQSAQSGQPVKLSPPPGSTRGPDPVAA
jgi:predicted dehydrogenase